MLKREIVIALCLTGAFCLMAISGVAANEHNNQVFLPLLQSTRLPVVNTVYQGVFEEQDGIFVTNSKLQRYYEDGVEKTNPYIGALVYSSNCARIHPFHFNDLEYPKSLFSIEEQILGITGFVLDAEKERLLVSVVLPGSDPYWPINKVYAYTFETKDHREVWMNELGFGSKYEDYQGSAYLDQVKEHFVVMRIMPCYACEPLLPWNTVVLNTISGVEKVLGEVGNVLMDVETNTVSFQHLVPVQVPCDPGPGCENGYKTIYEPAGEIFVEGLP